MLIRKVKKGDCLKIGNSVIQVRKATGENLTLAIDAPDGTDIHHAHTGEESDKAAENPESSRV